MNFSPKQIEHFRRKTLVKKAAGGDFPKQGSVSGINSGLNKGPVYRIQAACFDCRASFKRLPSTTGNHICPSCGGAAVEMGRAFRAPAKSKADAWKAAEMLYKAGFRFRGMSQCGNEHAPLPQASRDVARFIEEHSDHPMRLKRSYSFTS